MKLKTRTNQPVEGDELEGLKVNDDLEVEGDISVDEDSKVAIFENIVDKDGHPRFIEDDIEVQEITGVEYTYNKWSLSGTHLMFVIAGNIANTTAITSSNPMAIIHLPKWIYDKIYPTFSNIIEGKTVAIFDNGGTTQNAYVSFRKLSSPEENLTLFVTVTANADRYFRFSFDLLIDNE